MMGYLKQKKRQKNIRELLNVSVVVLSICCLLVLFFSSSKAGMYVNRWLFQIYLYTLCVMLYALFNKFFWQAAGLLLLALMFFFNIGMGCNLFFSIQTPGLQSLKILYQTEVSKLHDTEKQIKNNKVDVAGVVLDSEKNLNNLILTPHKVLRMGDILLSVTCRAGFAEIEIDAKRMMFISLDFASQTMTEKRIALKNLAEFINTQDVPVIVAGNFGQEAWSKSFLDFLDKTGLEVKNNILLSNGKIRFNPFVVPEMNILAYKDFGVRNVSFLSAKRNAYHPLMVELNY